MHLEHGHESGTTRRAHVTPIHLWDKLIPQAELTPERLAAELSACAGDRELVLERAERARAIARPDATATVTEACLAMEVAA